MIGALNPLSAASLFATFVLPVLLFGSEIWYLSEPLCHLLDQFQAELGKRILGLPKYHTNISVRVALHWPSFKVLVLCRKLSFLAKLLADDSDSQSARLFRTLSDDVYNITLVQQCRDLKAAYGTDFLHQCLLSPESAHSIVSEAKNTLLTLDWSLTCQEANTHPSLSCLCSKNMEDSWGNLWNCALDYGPAGTKIAQDQFLATRLALIALRPSSNNPSLVTSQMIMHMMLILMLFAMLSSLILTYCSPHPCVIEFDNLLN